MHPANPESSLKCRDCGAENDPGSSECWLCHRRDWRSDAAPVPEKTGATPGGGLSQLSIAGVIVAGAILVVGAGMVLELWNLSQFWVYLLLPTLSLPVVFILLSRIRKPVRGQRLTTLEFTAAGTTIAAGAIVLAWLCLPAAARSRSRYSGSWRSRHC